MIRYLLCKCNDKEITVNFINIIGLKFSRKSRPFTFEIWRKRSIARAD